jgi:pseudaminic acid synthase
MNQTIKIQDRLVGIGQPAYIIAELSANHNHDYQAAVDMVYAAKECGADAIKLQTYTADTLTIRSDKDYFKIQGGTLWDGKTLHELYQEAYTPWEWQPKLKRIADEIGIHLFSSPFDSTAVDFLEEMNVPCYKVASFEVVDIPLIEKIAALGKPMIMSTGMANLEEVNDAVTAARQAGCSDIILLKCTSAYPAPYAEMNLQAIPFLLEKFHLPVGLSDHTMGHETTCAAIALGACVIEKHFTLSRKNISADSAFSMEPHEFKTLCTAVRNIEQALGKPQHSIGPAEMKGMKFRRSLFVVKEMKAGDKLTCENLRSIRPGYGLPPKFYNELLGKKIKTDLDPGTPLCWDHLQR